MSNYINFELWGKRNTEALEKEERISVLFSEYRRCLFTLYDTRERVNTRVSHTLATESFKLMWDKMTVSINSVPPHFTCIQSHEEGGS